MPVKTPTKDPLLPDIPAITSKACRDSLAGLPQYDKTTYGCRKHRPTKEAALVESVLVVDADGLEPGGVEVEPLITGSDWFCEAVHNAMSTIMENQPHIDQAINGPESNH